MSTKAYNVDITQLGTSQAPRFSFSTDAPYKDGLIEDIILNESHPEYSKDFGTNIGMARIRLIPDDRGVPKEQLNWMMPLDTTIREYPLKNELVLVFYSLGRMFYTRRINATNKITESSWPGLSGKFSPPQPSGNKAEDIRLAAQGGPAYKPWANTQSDTLGYEFVENPTSRMVRPNEGDTIIQGRFGNVVRFGSSLFSNPITRNPQPNLLITVGMSVSKSLSTNNPSPYSLVYEDINKDSSCIWMVTDEKIILEPATIDSKAHLRTSETSDSTKYTGSQVIINSNRVLLNSKLNEISLFSKKEINLSAVEHITIDAGKKVMVSAEQDIELTTPTDIVLNARSVVINSPNDIVQGTSGNYVISGKKIFIGTAGDESQPMVLGGALAKWLQDLMSALSVDLVKSFITLNPTPFAQKLITLRAELGIDPRSAKFNSISNFTTRENT